jgi:hypothetical protein
MITTLKPEVGGKFQAIVSDDVKVFVNTDSLVLTSPSLETYR